MGDLIFRSFLTEMLKFDIIATTITYIILMGISIFIAKSKNRSVRIWFLLSLLLTPMLTVLLLLFTKSINEIIYTGKENLNDDLYKKYLTEKYSIEIDQSEAYACLGKRFNSLGEALDYCFSFELNHKKKKQLKIFLSILVYTICMFFYFKYSIDYIENFDTQKFIKNVLKNPDDVNQVETDAKASIKMATKEKNGI